MTWKKTKVLKWLKKDALPFWDIRLHRPYKEKNYKAKGLPPSWQQMCKAVGLRPDGLRKSRANAWLHLRGRGRRWRINGSRYLDVSCHYADFDRWANSTVKTFPLPQNKTELELYVRFTHYDT